MTAPSCGDRPHRQLGACHAGLCQQGPTIRTIRGDPDARLTSAILTRRTESLRLPEWFVSILMMERALDAVVRRAKRVDRKHDIPYLAGYSKRAITPARGECICGKRSACAGSPYRADYRRGYRADMLANEILSRELHHSKAGRALRGPHRLARREWVKFSSPFCQTA
jgi:hypothetical protein